MLTITSPATEQTIHMFKPVAEQMIRKLNIETGIANLIDTKILISGDNFGPSSNLDKEKNLILDAANRYVGKIRFELDPFKGMWDMASVGGMHHPTRQPTSYTDKYPIFSDTQNHIHLYEQGVPFTIEIEGEYHFINRTDAGRASNLLTMRYTPKQEFMLGDFLYEQKLPGEIVYSILHLSKYCGLDPQQLTEYLKVKSNGNIGVVESIRQNNKSYEYVVNYNVVHVPVIINFEQTAPAATGISDTGDYFVLPVTIRAQFYRTMFFHLHYPIIIQNRLVEVPEKMTLLEDPNGALDNILPLQSGSRGMNGILQMDPIKIRKPVRSPWYDNWHEPTPGGSDPNYFRIMIAAFTLDTLTPDTDALADTTVLDLNEKIPSFIQNAPTYQLTPLVLEYLQDNSCLQYGSEVLLEVYANDMLLDKSLLSVSEGKLTVKHGVGPNVIYRLVLKVKCVTFQKELAGLWMINFIIIGSKEQGV